MSIYFSAWYGTMQLFIWNKTYTEYTEINVHGDIWYRDTMYYNPDPETFI